MMLRTTPFAWLVGKLTVVSSVKVCRMVQPFAPCPLPHALCLIFPPSAFRIQFIPHSEFRLRFVPHSHFPPGRLQSLRLGERHSGFNVYCGKAIWPHNEEGLENLARYIIRASFSQERMTYIPANDASDGVSKVIYQSKDGTSTKTFDALDWLAQLATHIPHKGEQLVRYYGFYSNKSRGLRKKSGTDDQVPALIDSDKSPQAFRKNWARLIQ